MLGWRGSLATATTVPDLLVLSRGACLLFDPLLQHNRVSNGVLFDDEVPMKLCRLGVTVLCVLLCARCHPTPIVTASQTGKTLKCVISGSKQTAAC